MKTFKEYTNFVKSDKSKKEKYPIIYPALGLTGEAGEVADKVKKWLRGDGELNKKELIKECGDVLWYLTSMADDLGFTLDDVIFFNVEKTLDRRKRNVIKGSGDNR